VEVILELPLIRQYFILSDTIFVFVVQQYDLMVWVDFSLIGSDPKVSRLLAGIAMYIAVEGNCL